MTGKCKLCSRTTELKLSHFIPKFIGKWLKKTSITGYFREKNSLQRRSQDLPKEYWLCEDCELLFSGWERNFANSIFYPFADKGQSVAHYTDWLAKFCVSLSWRTLTYIRSHNKGEASSQEYVNAIESARNHWSKFLLGEENNLFQYEQHLYHLSEVESTTNRNSPSNMNRYFLRSSGMDVVGNQKNIYIYTKLPSFICLGIVKSDDTKMMRSSRVALKSGTIRPTTYYFPDHFMEYIFERANEVKKLSENIPKHQKIKIEEFVRNNPEKVSGSKSFEAILSDYELFGKDSLSEE